MQWFMSDPHYAHANIIRGCSKWEVKTGCRNFDTFNEHNNWLVNSINKKVKTRDELYCLGDWSFGGRDRIEEFRERINCERVHLIYGNHDTNIREDEYYQMLFESTQDYAELELNGGLHLILFHYPIETWHHKERGSVMLHGHVHKASDRMLRRFNLTPEGNWLMSTTDIRKRVKAQEAIYA